MRFERRQRPLWSAEFSANSESFLSFFVASPTIGRGEESNMANIISVIPRLRKEHESRLESLRQEADSLEARRKELDDRDYMHARRGIQNDLRQLIKTREQKFSLTSNTRRLRLPVHVAMILLLAGLLVVIHRSPTINKLFPPFGPTSFRLSPIPRGLCGRNSLHLHRALV